VVQGVIEALDARTAAGSLAGQGIVPLDIQAAAEERAGSPDVMAAVRQWMGQGGVSKVDLQLFSRQMNTLLKAGVPILRALEGLRQSATNPRLADVLADVLDNLQAGRELSACFARHPRVFDQFYCSMIQVGEITGQLDEMFLRLHQHLEFEREMSDRVTTALRYPGFVVVAMGMALVVINVFVVPAFAKVFASFHAELPLMTRMLIGFSDFTVRYGWALLFAVAGCSVLFRWWVRTQAGRLAWDHLKMQLPIAGTIVTKATLARFCRSFALSLRSGVPITTGLPAVALAVDNAHVRRVIEKMRDGIERGDSLLKNAIASRVFTPVVLQMIAVGEETGDLDGMMEEIAEFYQREVDSQLKSLSAQIEPILIIGLGVLVLVLALGVFLPMWDLGRVSQGRG
jgi:MSHA biogenesis protein MshG